MNILKITDPAFRKYGRVVDGVDFKELLALLEKTPVTEGVVYQPRVAEWEETPAAAELRTRLYGELAIQIGFCNGHNYRLNALEYHKGTEINLAADDVVLLLGLQSDISENFTYDTAKIEAFLLPRGMAAELYGTSLHYAPCAPQGQGFRVAVILPQGTNAPLVHVHHGGEDGHLTAVNKWLLGHPEGGLPAGSPLGLIGDNLAV